MGQAIGAGLGIIGSVMQYNAANAAADAKQTAAIHSYNYSVANMEMERQSLFDQAVDQITATQLKAQAKLGAVDVALGENMRGQSANLIRRAAEAGFARKEGTIRTNYEIRANNLQQNEDMKRVQTQSYIENIPRPSEASLMLNIGSQLYGLSSRGADAQVDAQTKGLDFSWDDWLWKGSGVKSPTASSAASRATLSGGTDVNDAMVNALDFSNG